MKKLLSGLALAAFSMWASATTLNPIQLLNPVGSTSGQAIVSTGASTVPAWSNVAATSLASQAANTVVANVTGSAASPTAFAMPSCTGATNALGYTSGTGIVCNGSINAASLAGQTFTSPTITTPNITGVTNASNAAAGSVGEVIQATFSAVNITASGTAQNLTSISLTAGDWDVSGSFIYGAAATTNTAFVVGGVNTVSATLPAVGQYYQLTATFPVNAAVTVIAPIQRINVSTTTTVFLVGFCGFSTSTASATGFLRARRIR